jgi:hypothetical protein
MLTRLQFLSPPLSLPLSPLLSAGAGAFYPFAGLIRRNPLFSRFCPISMRPMKTLPLCLAAFLAVQCTTPPAPEAHTDTPDATRYVPAWAKEAVWYQVFVERFHNGDPSNDPTLHDIEGAYPDEQPAG